MAKFGAAQFWLQFLNTTAKFGANAHIVGQEHPWSVNGGCYFRWAFGWLLLILQGLWVVAIISWRLLGTMEMCMPRERKMTPGKEAPELKIPRHNLAHFCCAKICLSKFRVFLIFPSPVYTTGGRGLANTTRQSTLPLQGGGPRYRCKYQKRHESVQKTRHNSPVPDPPHLDVLSHAPNGRNPFHCRPAPPRGSPPPLCPPGGREKSTRKAGMGRNTQSSATQLRSVPGSRSDRSRLYHII